MVEPASELLTAEALKAAVADGGIACDTVVSAVDFSWVDHGRIVKSTSSVAIFAEPLASPSVLRSIGSPSQAARVVKELPSSGWGRFTGTLKTAAAIMADLSLNAVRFRLQVVFRPFSDEVTALCTA